MATATSGTTGLGGEAELNGDCYKAAEACPVPALHDGTDQCRDKT
jgi:hypothetical protein